MKGDLLLESTITSKGQTTLPKDVRDRLGVGPGDKVRYLVIGDEVRIVKPRKAMSLCGALKHEGAPVSLEDMDAALRARAAGSGGDP
ncbi:MAG: AbrB/MazE/SpoVT family DNA-binding domain-containing protein [Pseudomonadota bacterium]